ncbi:DUF378 domain-containing protein [Virgibacillus sp. MSJ-26]|uniref:DUF378 domain-containing protein n=1 Tax=Virgibacillus sp. MSJ-26 TaxID=2841522 RepID=UPI001C105FC3|nr:DUF378 domain-containing protein [Virgibacillus sp. MSJ-26]MBU5468525.1 DUF378 domain-containing protein [Virgibacillus sp. MSJ-26]
MDTLKRIALTLLIIGGVNWGLIGLFQFDLVAAMFGGQNAAFSRVIYTLVGISALVSIAILFDPLSDATNEDDYQPIQTNKANYGMEMGDENDPDYFHNDDQK